MLDHEPQEIPQVIGSQENLPSGAAPKLENPGIKEKVIKPVINKTKSGVKKGRKWAAGLAALTGMGGVIYWLGWGERGKGIWGGTGPLNKNAESSPADLPPEERIEYDREQQLLTYAKRGIGTNAGHPEIKGVNDANFLNPNADMLFNLAGKSGASFLFPTHTRIENEVITENVINDILVNEMINQTGYTREYLLGPSDIEGKSIWIKARDDRDFALSLLQNSPKPVDGKVISFFQKANELITNDLNPQESQDRNESLREWFQINIATPQGRETQGKEIGWDWTESFADMAGNIGISPEELMGNLTTLRVEWQFDPNAISRQLKVVEMAAQAMPERKMSLYAGFAATHADWIMSCVMVGLMAVGLNAKPAAILVDRLGQPIGAVKEHGQELMSKLAQIGENLMSDLREKSADFRDWIEEKRRRKNSHQLVNRLRNGLSLSREFVFDLGGILNNAQNQDLRDLVLIEGSNWFRHIPETHPELPQILLFFGCKNYSGLQELANKPDRIVNRLYSVLVGRGKKADLRKTEQVKKLIGLYKQTSGFSEVGSQ